MTYEQNIRAVLNCHFSCVRQELIDNAVKCIVDLKCMQVPYVNEMTNWDKWVLETIVLADDNKSQIICNQYDDCNDCPLRDVRCADSYYVNEWLNAKIKEDNNGD